MTSVCGYSSRTGTARHCSGRATPARAVAPSPLSCTPARLGRVATRTAPTRLQRELANETPPRRPTPLDAFLLARRKFLAAERIDMSALADELGVNRVTLYRWVGSREQLLVEVVWSLGSRSLEKVDARVRAKGAERIVRVVTRFLEAVISNEGMRRWLAEEGELAMRLIPRHDTDFQPLLIAAVPRLLA